MLLFEVDEVTCKVTAAHDSNVLVLPFTVTYAFTQQGANWLHYIESGYYITLAGPRAQHGFGFEVLLNDVQEV